MTSTLYFEEQGPIAVFYFLVFLLLHCLACYLIHSSYPYILFNLKEYLKCVLYRNEAHFVSNIGKQTRYVKPTEEEFRWHKPLCWCLEARQDRQLYARFEVKVLPHLSWDHVLFSVGRSLLKVICIAKLREHSYLKGTACLHLWLRLFLCILNYKRQFQLDPSMYL